MELVGAEGLASPEHARVVRAGKDGAPEVTDGPYAEAKEFLAGYWIVDVETTDRAYAIAGRASAAPGKGGAPMNMPIEVREVMSAPPVEGMRRIRPTLGSPWPARSIVNKARPSSRVRSIPRLRSR